MSMSIYITQIELATGSFDGPAIYARCWSDAQHEADHLGVTLVGRLEGEDETEEPTAIEDWAAEGEDDAR